MNFDQAATEKSSHKDWLDQPLAVQRGEVAGIPAFWVPGEGETTAGIVFRTGVVDEPLALSGINHVIRHVINAGPCPSNVAGRLNDSWLTGFSACGSGKEIAGQFARMQNALASISSDAINNARLAMAAEASRTSGPLEELLRLRHGAMGLGTRSFEEWGVRRAGEPDVEAWRLKYFHAGNAAIWIAGPFPDELCMGLQRRSRVAGPLLQDLPLSLPGGVVGPAHVVALSVVAEDSPAFATATWLLRERSRRLQGDTALCRSIDIRVERSADGRLELTCVATIPIEQAEEASQAVLGMFDELATTPVGEQEIDGYREAVAARFFDSTAIGELAYSAAADYLLYTESRSWALTLDELAALDGVSISAAFAAAMETVIAMLPPGVTSAQRFPSITTEVPRVQGAQLEAVRLKGEDKADRALVASTEGITVVRSNVGSTVRFETCAAVLRREDGSRLLVDNDGTQVMVDPRAWKSGATIAALVDRAVPLERTVTMLSSTQGAGRGMASASPASKVAKRATWRKVAAAAVVAVMLLATGGFVYRLAAGNDDMVAAAEHAQGVDNLPKCSQIDTSQYAAGQQIKCQPDQMSSTLQGAGTGIGILTVFGFAYRMRRLIRLLKRILG